MLNEKQTDSLSWQNRLSQLDSLPEEYSNKNDGWEKLQERLQEKPPRNKAVWYWAAAALLLLLAIPFVVKKQSQYLPVQEIVHNKQTPAPVTRAPETIKEQTPVISSPLVKIFTPPVIIKKQPLPGNRIDKKNSIPLPVAIAIVPVEIKTGGIVPAIDTTVTLVAAVVPPKKKLPVVHINEIGRQEQENAKFATQWQRHSFQIKFLNQENNPGVALPAASANQEPVKITIPLKN